MFARLSIKIIGLTFALATGLSLPGGAALADGPLTNNENLHARGSRADVQSGKGVYGYPEEFEAGSSTQQRGRGNVWKSPAGNGLTAQIDGIMPRGLHAKQRGRKAK